MRSKHLNVIGSSASPFPATVEPSTPGLGQGSRTAAVVTLGCAKNQVDSEVMLGVLRSRGYAVVSDLHCADLIVVNTCGFLQSAVEESVDRILEVARHKQSGRCKRLVVAGCMVERYRGQLSAEFPEVDRFISTDELLTVCEDIATTDDCFDRTRKPYFLYDSLTPRVTMAHRGYSYIKISEGCNRPCTFCIIPKLRGEFRSRSMDSIVTEARMLLESGVKEINLVGQDLTSYGSDFVGGEFGKSQIGQLIRKLDTIDAVSEYWIRALYSYPLGVTDAFMDVYKETSHLCGYLDIPLQHVSSGVLTRMKRPLGEKGTRRLIERLRRELPGLALRTTFIVGFPGETDEDVAVLRDFILEGHFMHVGVFEYSQEEEAESFHYNGQIDDELKAERKAVLMEAQQEVLKRHLGSFIGQRVRVLIEGPHDDSDLLLVGRTSFQAPETDGLVIINDIDETVLNSLGGQVHGLQATFCDVEITEVAGYDLIATVC